MADLATIIIGGPDMETSDILYRRIRLAYYLAKNEERTQIYWIYAENCALHNFSKISVKNHNIENNKYITSIKIHDYKFLLSRFLGGSWIAKKVSYKIKPYKKAKLIYTLPRFQGFIRVLKNIRVIYDVSDNWAGQYPKISLKNRILRKILEGTENYLLEKSQIITASSSSLAEISEKRCNKKVVYLSNGVDYKNFNKPYSNTNFPREGNYKATIGFSGSLKNRDLLKLDIKLISYLAERKSEWKFVLIGPTDKILETRLQKLNQKTNVDFIGYVKPTNLARYIKKFDVAILPYLENDFTKGIVPLKLYEYIAAGIPVVAANLPSVEKLAKETSLYKVAGSYSEYLMEIQNVLSTPITDGQRSKYKQIAKEFDWNVIFRKFHRLIDAPD